MWRPDGPMHETAWWSSWQGALIIALLLAIVGLLIWLLARSRAMPSGGPARDERAEDEAVAHARMRYARGELDRAGFLQTVQDLTGAAPATAPAAAAPASAAAAAAAETTHEEPSAAPGPPDPPESPTAEPA